MASFARWLFGSFPYPNERSGVKYPLRGNAARLQRVLPIPRPCEFMESGREKQLKPYPMGDSSAARRMIRFQEKSESGFGPGGAHLKPQGPLSDEPPFIRVVVMGQCLISHVM